MPITTVKKTIFIFLCGLCLTACQPHTLQLQNPLITAIVNNQPEKIRDLLQHGVDANTTLQDGTSALIVAAAIGNLTSIQLLQQHGANINYANSQGTTALMAAAGAGNTDALKLLVTYGADPCLIDRNHRTALQVGEQWWGALETTKLLKNDKSLLRIVCSKNKKG